MATVDETIGDFEAIMLKAQIHAAIDESCDEAKALELLLSVLCQGQTALTVAIACHQIAARAVMSGAPTPAEGLYALKLLQQATIRATEREIAKTKGNS